MTSRRLVRRERRWQMGAGGLREEWEEEIAGKRAVAGQPDSRCSPWLIEVGVKV